MMRLRNQILEKWQLGLLFLVLCLILRALVPTGYMISADPGGPLVRVCGQGQVVALNLVQPPSGRSHDAGSRNHNRVAPCPYAVIGAPALATEISTLPEAPAALVSLLSGLALAVIVVNRPVRDRPPTRAPPLTA